MEENHGIKVDFNNIGYEDPLVLEMFARAETLGIFQFESPGMRNFLKELKPNVFENLIAANSLYRPGPMNQIPVFVACKHDPSQIQYIHPKLEHILDVTYGCIVYQEQVMQIVRDIGGYSLGRADLVRRAMGKKKMDVMEEERRNFIYGQTDEEGNVTLSGAIRNGVDEKSASKIYDLMIDFANYAFNKSHSAAYAVVAYRTAWLKYYYPVEFMAALISSVMGNTNQVSLYIQECKRLGIEILAPDVNESSNKFTVSEGKIRFGLSAVKNVGENFINAIIKGRQDEKFKNFTDFVEKIEKADSNVMNKRAVESLIKCGAMDSLGANRAQLSAIFEKTIDSIHADRKRNIEGQFSLFDNPETNAYEDNLPDIKEFQKNIILAMEKEVVGIYISGHPLEAYKKQIENASSISTFDLINTEENLNEKIMGIKDGDRVALGGIIVEKKNMITKNNNMMAFITIEDLFGTVECIVFPTTFERYNKFLLEDNIVVIEGKINISEVEAPKIIVERISELKSFNHGKLYLKIRENSPTNIMDRIKSILIKYNGNMPVYVYFEKDKKAVMADRSLWIDINNKDCLMELKEILGENAVKLVEG